ncbi:heparan-alpha-glucosaminide N-acetyltransferase domain-containing protein [Demequina sp. SYSU T00192]|uniref:Heparan-alpha-glucosaminide N-acetyltransferase domain-containing protein n=1 Tax=Demequina litoralis TaxID=3051660 RepID=A0ABT8GCA8_9MICO|nr:heparan-alpha-glucosaminide N-acetyltransferase domain-containing protein [Demequina sp. SYSU T00192]MDN4476776.1 heparan-alpha-glucosaminide N-acetyltransferase domain-containing protein [Demequina sp. SYSU T00192]
MSGSRIVGLDVARGLAVLGMVAAHVGADGSRGDGEPWPWLVASHGRPSALFAVLAGVTIALMLARAGGRDDARAVRHTRARVATRAGLLVVLGLVLAELSTGVDIILVNLGLMMLLAIPLLRVPSWALLGIAGVAFAFGRIAVEAVRPGGWWEAAPVVGRLWSLHYPALAWIGYVLLGVVVGRLALRTARTQALLVGLGLMAAAGAALVRIVAGDGAVTGLVAHSYTPVEMAHNAGVAVAVIGASCWAAPRARALLSPVEAVGAMALSAYVLQVLVIWVVGTEMVYEPSNVALVALELVLLATAWGWRRAGMGQGPLERVLTAASNAAGDVAVRALPAPRDPEEVSA